MSANDPKRTSANTAKDISPLDRLLFQAGDCGGRLSTIASRLGLLRLRERTQSTDSWKRVASQRLRQRGLCLGAPSRARPETVAGSIRRRETDEDSA